MVASLASQIGGVSAPIVASRLPDAKCQAPHGSRDFSHGGTGTGDGDRELGWSAWIAVAPDRSPYLVA